MHPIVGHTSRAAAVGGERRARKTFVCREDARMVLLKHNVRVLLHIYTCYA